MYWCNHHTFHLKSSSSNCLPVHQCVLKANTIQLIINDGTLVFLNNVQLYIVCSSCGSWIRVLLPGSMFKAWKTVYWVWSINNLSDEKIHYRKAVRRDYSKGLWRDPCYFMRCSYILKVSMQEQQMELAVGVHDRQLLEYILTCWSNAPSIAIKLWWVFKCLKLCIYSS